MTGTCIDGKIRFIDVSRADIGQCEVCVGSGCTDTLKSARVLIARQEETITLQEDIIKTLQGRLERMSAAEFEKDKKRIETLNIIHDLLDGIATVDMK